MSRIDDLIKEIIKVEGGYTNNPNDKGGETNYGITIAVARANGYTGDMKAMPVDVAKSIYKNMYVVKPGFDKVLALSEAIGAEVVDTGVNMGQGIAAKFLQRALNGLNNRGKLYGDVLVDGQCGPGTIAALTAFLKHRGKDGETVLVKALNCLQGTRYLEIAEASPQNEDFVYGWIKNRV